jgi:hypothetical protein
MELLAFCVVALALLAPAPAPAGEYTPAVGQAGKDVIWVPTEQRLVEKMLDLAKLTPYDYLIDLGSGDGRTVITAAKRGARALGIEYNPDMVELSKRNAATEGVAGRAQFVQADIFASDFSKATVLTLFLLPELNLKLRPTILNMAPGTRVVSNTFTMGDWQADEVGTIPEPCSTHCTALLWIVPAKVAGEWRLGQGRLSLTQTFQMLSGTLEADGKSVPVTTGRVTGDEITFTAGNVQYAGWVSGKTMRGVSRSGAMTDAWNAVRAN